MQFTPTASTARARCRERRGLRERGAVADPLLVAAGEADPRTGVRVVLEQGHDAPPPLRSPGSSPRRGRRARRRAAPPAGAGASRSRLWTLRPYRPTYSDPSASAGAVRTDGRRDESITAGLLLRPSRASSTERRSSRSVSAAVQPAPREPFERGLVARGDRDVGPGGEVRGVHRPDRLGVLDEQARRPEVVEEVGAATLELGREPPVQHESPRRTGRPSILRRYRRRIVTPPELARYRARRVDR